MVWKSIFLFDEGWVGGIGEGSGRGGEMNFRKVAEEKKRPGKKLNVHPFFALRIPLNVGRGLRKEWGKGWAGGVRRGSHVETR